MKTSLDLLNAIQIPKPCTANWTEMIGDEYARFCGICEKHVYNLSALSAEDAANLMREKEGKLCVRLYRRLDGTVMTADCQPSSTRGLVKHIAAAVTLAGSLLAAGCNAPETEGTPATPENPTEQTLEQGKMCMGEPAMPMMGSPAPLPPEKEVLKVPPREVLELREAGK